MAIELKTALKVIIPLLWEAHKEHTEYQEIGEINELLRKLSDDFIEHGDICRASIGKMERYPQYYRDHKYYSACICGVTRLHSFPGLTYHCPGCTGSYYYINCKVRGFNFTFSGLLVSLREVVEKDLERIFPELKSRLNFRLSIAQFELILTEYIVRKAGEAEELKRYG